MIDNFAALSEALGNRDGSLLDLRGRYTTSHSDASLRELGQRINAANSPAKRDALRKLLRVGLHTDVEVTATEWGKTPVGRATFEEQPDGHSVAQVLCSACSLDYGKRQGIFSLKMPLARERAVLWEPLARLVLEAAYEATILTALRQGAKVVFLTLLGGGCFKNDVGWIVDAIARALDLVRHCSLQVQIVCYEARAHPLVTKLVEKVQSGVIPLAPVRLLD